MLLYFNIETIFKPQKKIGTLMNALWEHFFYVIRSIKYARLRSNLASQKLYTWEKRGPGLRGWLIFEQL